MADCTSILHVYSQVTDQVTAILREIEKLDVTSQHVHDCHMALAELVKVGDGRHIAILVSLDGVGSEEREFFQIVRRLYRQVPVYVYGMSPRAMKTEEAIRLGARRTIDAQQVASLLQVARPVEVTLRSSSPRFPEPDTEREFAVADEPTFASEEDYMSQRSAIDRSSEDSEREVAIEDDFLMRRRSTSNLRQPPSAAQVEPDLQKFGLKSLLTAEELEALLSEDDLETQ